MKTTSMSHRVGVALAAAFIALPILVQAAPIPLLYDGNYSTTANYSKGDVVTYSGISYLANGIITQSGAHAKHVVPPTLPWKQLTFEGPQGATGATGVQGQQGNQGQAGINGTTPFTMALHATNASGVGIQDEVLTTISSWTTDFDTANSFDASDGIFTAPTDGKYYISANLTFTNADNWDAGGGAQLFVHTGGVSGPSYQVSTFRVDSGGVSYRSISGSVVLNLKAGTQVTLLVNTYQTGHSHLLDKDQLFNNLSIFRVAD